MQVVSAVPVDVVSGHMKYCRITYDITRQQNALQGTDELMTSGFMAF